MALERLHVRAPEFPLVQWLNCGDPPTLAGCRGNVVLIDVWDFTSTCCLATLPTLRDWHERYAEAGLAILGVHTPQFAFARDVPAVRRAVGRLGVCWPVALDNDQAIRALLTNLVRPTVDLVDRAGYVRFRLEGECGYVELEEALRSLLQEPPGPAAPLPERSAVREASSDATCRRRPPEFQAESVGNGPLPEDETITLAMPASRPQGAFYLAGEWRLAQRGLTLVGGPGEVMLPFEASSVHVVAANGDKPPLETPEPAWVEVELDGRPVPDGCYGADLLSRQGATWLPIVSARDYALALSLPAGSHELRLRAVSPGTTFYAFSFPASFDSLPAERSDPC
ncbi:MAG TPA: hypothetical protein VK449_01210 [Anaerolineales bacterium]|nr:hypothetical protein [Anaerolineales bacterium]